MNSQHDVPVHPADATGASEPVCPHCGGTGYYHPALPPGDPHYSDADYLEPCPYCAAYQPDPLSAPQHNPLNDAKYRASGHEMQVFALIGILLLLIGSAIGVVHAIAQTQRGVISSPFYDGYLAGWILLGLAVVLAVTMIVYVGTRRAKKR